MATPRSTMADIIAELRLMIADPAGNSPQFLDLDIQRRLDDNRSDVRYEPLQIAPSIVNTASTGNVPSTIYADYYSKYGWWEADVVLQGQSATGAAWTSLTPLASDLIVGHWQFELTPFTNGTIPGQLPPIFATGKVYDLNAAAADLLEYWAATVAANFDFTSDGQSFRRSQVMTMKLDLSKYYRARAKPKVMKVSRSDIATSTSVRGLRLMDSDDVLKGV